jgi:hypothetical protein
MSKILGGGGDRFDVRPLSPDGNRDTNDEPTLDNMVGCHSGGSFGLNITNPQPGYIYVWERRKPQDILRARQKGGTVVLSEDPEFSVSSQLVGGFEATPLDSSDIYNDVVLVRYPEEVIRKRREQETERSKAQLRGSAEEFVSRATNAEIQFSGGKPSRFARRDHVTEVRSGFDENANLEEVWAPDRGIVD